MKFVTCICYSRERLLGQGSRGVRVNQGKLCSVKPSHWFSFPPSDTQASLPAALGLLLMGGTLFQSQCLMPSHLGHISHFLKTLAGISHSGCTHKECHGAKPLNWQRF